VTEPEPIPVAEQVDDIAPKPVPFIDRFWILLIGGIAIGLIVVMCAVVGLIFALRD
jgi:hypothetical protein